MTDNESQLRLKRYLCESYLQHINNDDDTLCVNLLYD